MQCPSCRFENMPGQAKCTRCGATLTPAGPVSAGDVTPPRAGMFRFLRPIRYFMNRMTDRMYPKTPVWLSRLLRGGDADLPGTARAAILLSVVPGLGHLTSGRRRAMLIASGVWLAGAVLVVNFYAGWIGGALAGLLVSWHTAVMFDAGRVRQHARSLTSRLWVMFGLLLAMGFAYYSLDRWVHRYVDFIPAPYAVPSMGVQMGDALLVRRGSNLKLDRGSLVSAYMDQNVRLPVGRTRSGEPLYVVFRGDGQVLRCVQALPNDIVEVSEEGLRVNGTLIDRASLPDGLIPFPSKPASFQLQSDEVLAIFPVGGMLDTRIDVANVIWKQLYLIKTSQVRGKAVGVYLPLSRRSLFNQSTQS